jgi:hypothetical protein
MSDQPPSEPAGTGVVAAMIDRVLHYMDRPWRVVAVVVLLILCGVGFVLYEQRDELIEAWLTPSSVELKTAEIPPALQSLIEETSADLVQIWAVDLPANSQRFLSARRRDGERPVIPEPRRLPVIVATSDIRALTNVLAGNPACVGTAEADAPLMERLASRGIVRACAVPIPPGGSILVGIIYLAWEKPPEVNDEDGALVAAREIAGKLATH